MCGAAVWVQAVYVTFDTTYVQSSAVSVTLFTDVLILTLQLPCFPTSESN